MNETINDAEIKVSEKAAKEIKRIMVDNKIPDTYGLRVGVKGGGCSGLTYTLGFDGESRDGDTIVNQDNIKLFIDGKSLFYLMGTELDFSEGLDGKGFYFNNPNAARTCSCGESFSL